MSTFLVVHTNKRKCWLNDLHEWSVSIYKNLCSEKYPHLILTIAACHDDVVRIINICAHYGAVCIPFGGGTNVSGAVYCPANERRTIISLDTSQMNRILWIDRDNLLVCCESGIIGQDLERQLRFQGFTCGHEPDSYEFSRYTMCFFITLLLILKFLYKMSWDWLQVKLALFITIHYTIKMDIIKISPWCDTKYTSSRRIVKNVI